MNADPDALGIVFVLVIYGFAFLIGIGISALISYFLYRTAVVIPENQRLVSPGAAFLLMIPLFNLIWVFIYTSNLSKSYQNIFSQQMAGTDDCGEKLGMWWGICGLLSFVPCVNIFSGIAGLIVMIMYIIKVSECRSRFVQYGTAWNDFYGTPTSPRKSDPNNPYTF